jgi:glycosyltransferase involved in cell wall biosynthesis
MNKRTVCFVARLDLLDKPGGDTTQWRLYEKAAREAGFCTQTWFEDRRIPDADVYHALNVDRPLELYPRLRQVKRRGRPFILSTIHHPHAWLVRFRMQRQPMDSAIKMAYRHVFGRSVERTESVREIVVLTRQRRLARVSDLWPIWINRVRWLLGAADKVALASGREADFLKRDFGFACSSEKLEIVPNWIEGVSGDGFQAPAVIRDMPEAPVIVVGRIESRKNLLRVCRLANQASRPLIFIGWPNPSERAYEDELRRGLSRLVQWVPGVDRQQMAGFYRHASFLLNASYAEVSPLVDVEALMFGCPVATTRYALHHEYLPEGTPQCDAHDDHSILELMKWRPQRIKSFCAVDADECKRRLVAIYTQLAS